VRGVESLENRGSTPFSFGLLEGVMARGTGTRRRDTTASRLAAVSECCYYYYTVVCMYTAPSNVSNLGCWLPPPPLRSLPNSDLEKCFVWMNAIVTEAPFLDRSLCLRFNATFPIPLHKSPHPDCQGDVGFNGPGDGTKVHANAWRCICRPPSS
jgi:hypothetical protein